MAKRFIIIDGSSLVYRAFYALPLLMTAQGQYTNAVYGFMTMLMKLMAAEQPESIVVAFDKGKLTFRNDTYAEYKAHRKPTPPELSAQFPIVKDVLTALGITVLEQDGYEADDIIGTLATQAAEVGQAVTIVTGDRDALQLIAPHIEVLLTKKGITDMVRFDEAQFVETYGLQPPQLIDLKGLMGDASDNIPGVPGVGEKTALKLIREFQSVENVLQHIENISGKKLKESLTEHAEAALMSKKLATIVCDMPLSFAEAVQPKQPDLVRVKELFQTYEFKSLLPRVEETFSAVLSPVEQERAEMCQPVIAQLSNSGQLLTLSQQVRQAGIMYVMPLATGALPDLKGSGLAVWADGEPAYITWHMAGWECIAELLGDSQVAKVTYDAKKLYTICHSEGCAIANIAFDVLLAAYLLDPAAAAYPLVGLAQTYLSTEYAAEDGLSSEVAAGQAVCMIKSLYPVLSERLDSWELTELYETIELPLAKILASMEQLGITVRRQELESMSVEISAKIEVLLADIYQQAGEMFNVNSTKQLGHILFDKLQLPIIKKTKTGYSTDAEVLDKLAGQHPVIDNLLEYRVLTKLKSTYLDGLAGLIHERTQRIHTTFNQTVTATGRLSSSEPNLQNIPIRTEAGRKIRELFVPGDGYTHIMSADYSQIELRILAHLSGDAGLIDAFRQNHDIHTRTAAEVFGVPMAEVTSEMRSRAKAVNFGIVYGISDYGLSRDIGVTRKEAAEYIASYFDRYHAVKAFIDEVVKEAHRTGYVTTVFKRRRYLPDINNSNFNLRSFAERMAMNTPIQGTAADIIKKAMIDVYCQLQAAGVKSRILLQVHDELLLEVVDEEIEQVSQIVKQAMEAAVTLSVPMTAEVKVGKNWAGTK